MKEARANGYVRFWTSLCSQDYLPSRSSPCRRGTQDVGWAGVVSGDTRSVLLFQFGKQTRLRRRAVRVAPLIVKRQLMRLFDQEAATPLKALRLSLKRPSLPSPPSSSPSGGLPGRRLLSQAPTVTNPRSILRHMGEGSASGIVGLVRVT